MASPKGTGGLARQEPSSPAYKPISPNYSPTSPGNVAAGSPAFSPTSPAHVGVCGDPSAPGSTTPAYSPTTPINSPASPRFSPSSPSYDPTAPRPPTPRAVHSHSTHHHLTSPTTPPRAPTGADLSSTRQHLGLPNVEGLHLEEDWVEVASPNGSLPVSGPSSSQQGSDSSNGENKPRDDAPSQPNDGAGWVDHGESTSDQW